MPGKVAVMDNAGVFSRLIDKSQVAGDLSPNALYGAFPVNAERGFMNIIVRLTRGVSDRVRYFGAKNWRTRGRSLHDLDKYLESSQPAYAVRAGYVDPNSGRTSAHNRMAAVDFYPYPAMSGRLGMNLFASDSEVPLVTDVSSSTNRSDSQQFRPGINIVVDIGTKRAEVELNEFGIHAGKNFVIQKAKGEYLLPDIYTFDRNKITIGGLEETPMPAVVVRNNDGGWTLSGTDSSGETVSVDYDGADPTLSLRGDITENKWIVEEGSVTGAPFVTPFVFLLGEPHVDSVGLTQRVSEDIDGNVKTTVKEVINYDEDNDAPDGKVYFVRNLEIKGLKKRKSTNDSYENLTRKDLFALFMLQESSALINSLAVVISTIPDEGSIELEIGESISFYDVIEKREEKLLFDCDESGYLQASNEGYELQHIDSNVFPIASNKAIAIIFAKGEGAWGNRIEVTISQQAFNFVESSEGNFYVEGEANTGLPKLYRKEKREDRWVAHNNPNKNTSAGFFNRFEEEDGPRIFSVTIVDTLTGVTEYYPNVSFNPHDVDGSGVSIYIASVINSKSDMVGIIVNEEIENAGYARPVDRKDLWVLPVSVNKDEKQKAAIPYVFTETVRLSGGTEFNLNEKSIPVESGIPGNIETVRSVAFQNALQIMLDKWLTHDSYLAFNAGQEILNPDFANLIASSNGGQPRVLGLTSVSIGDAMAQDEMPADIPEERGGPSGGVATPWVAKYNQWVLGTDSDAGQQIYTSPVGWVGKLIGLNAIAGMLPYAPAGYRRGILHGAFGLSRSWEAKQRLGVVEYKWNPIKYDPTAGYVVWDALTSQPIKSALSNIHVILAYQAMRRGIEQTLKGFEFEFNDESTVKTMLNLLRGMADSYVSQKFAEQIIVDAAENEYGTDQIRIRWNVRFKEVARTIVVDVTAYPSSQDLAVSMAG